MNWVKNQGAGGERTLILAFFRGSCSCSSTDSIVGCVEGGHFVPAGAIGEKQEVKETVTVLAGEYSGGFKDRGQ